MAPEDDRTSLFHPFRSAFDDLDEDVDVEPSPGKCNDVERRHRVPAHRIYVTERVGCRNLPEDVWIVDDRREKIDRVDNGQVRPEAEYARIVGGLGSDNEIGMDERRKLTQHLRQVGRAELGRSTSGSHLLRQADGLHRGLPSAACYARRCLFPDTHAVFVRPVRFSSRTSPFLTVTPSRSKYSRSGIAYLRLVR